MTLQNLCKACRHVEQMEVIHGHKIAGWKPICDYLMPSFPAAKHCDGFEEHDPYDEARLADHS